jgi:hypothetical protein
MFSADLHLLPPAPETPATGFIEQGLLPVERSVQLGDYVSARELSFVPSSSPRHFFQTKPSYPRLAGVHLVDAQADHAQPGFMFWSVAIVPPRQERAGLAVVWDTAAQNVQARDLRNISHVVWQIDRIKQVDCVTVAADQGHVYLSDSSAGPSRLGDWIGAIAKSFAAYNHVTKFLIVADMYTGDILLNMTLPNQPSAFMPSFAIPGALHDVYVGTPSGVVRVYAGGDSAKSSPLQQDAN